MMFMMEAGTLASLSRKYHFWGDVGWSIVAIVAAILLAMLIGYLSFQNARPFRIEYTTSLPPQQALDALQKALASQGWTLGFRDHTSLVMNTDRNASFGSTAAAGCVSVWLALLLLLSSRKTIVVRFEAEASNGGTLITCDGNRTGSGVLTHIAAQLRNLPKSSSTDKPGIKLPVL